MGGNAIGDDGAAAIAALLGGSYVPALAFASLFGNKPMTAAGRAAVEGAAKGRPRLRVDFD